MTIYIYIYPYQKNKSLIKMYLKISKSAQYQPAEQDKA